MPTLTEYEDRGIDITLMTSEQLEAEGYITPFNELPVIIDGKGEYLTRNGRKVIIHDWAPNPKPCVTASTAKGQVFVQKNRMMRYTETWHVCGRRFPLTTSQWDIVSKD